MASHSLAQYLFPPSTVIQVYNPIDVDVEKQSNRQPMDQTPVAGISAGASAVAATLTIDPTGTNNSVDYTAQDAGADGNDITIAYLNNGASQTLEIDVIGTTINVNLATDGSSVATSTADDIKTAIAADDQADALVSAADHAGNDGSGVVVAAAAAPLSGGSDTLGTNQALVDADGTLTVDVGTGASYYAVGQVGSDYRYLRFNVDAP